MGDETSDDLVENLFREVDDHFADLEAQYKSARQELAAADADRRDREVDFVQSTAERYELVSEVASLRSDLSRASDALAERDRLLNELSERIGGFEKQIREGEEAIHQERQTRQQLVEERREVSRLNALLEARLAERTELTDLAHRVQGEKEHVETLLTTALAKFEQVDQLRSEVSDKLARLEAARQSESTEFEARGMQLTEAKTELKRLRDLTAELTVARDDAEQRAQKFEGLVERRANEINYLNRRIDGLNNEAGRADGLEEDLESIQRENTLLNRRVGELESALQSQTVEVEASARAVESLASATSERDEFAAKVEELERALDDRQPAPAAPVDSPVASASVSASTASAEIQRLTRRVEELGTTNLYQPSAEVAAPAPPPPAAPSHAVGVPSPPAPPAPDTPRFKLDATATATAAADRPAGSDATSSFAEDLAATAQPPRFDLGDPSVTADSAPSFALTGADPSSFVARQRAVLPAEITPNSDRAIEFLLSQSGVAAIVDARSCCSETGMRPSELFDRLAGLRDRFDVPIEVVVTPVSTPVGGSPSLSAVGVHSVTGADTVADRVRALCLGFPGDQPLVVIAADEHVRRSALNEEANVIEPSAVLDLTTF